jgi:TatD DNase family protein
MRLFDAHCHLQMPQFDADRNEVVARMQEKGMEGVIPGVDFETSKSAIELARQHDFLYAAVGLHPNDNLTEEFDEEKYAELASDPNVVAIGECGLDYFRSGKTGEERAAQFKRFEAQLQLALHTNKALIIHCRDAHEDMLEILTAHRRDHGEKLRVIIHFFTGTAHLAQQYLDLGCYLSFPGPITYTDMYDESIRVAPLDKILSETDAPFAAPMPNRGKRNEPAYVSEVVKKIAALKSEPVEVVIEHIYRNAHKVFNIQ